MLSHTVNALVRVFIREFNPVRLRHIPSRHAQIPVDYEWPIELSGMQLGSICKQMRIGDIWAKHVRHITKA